MNNIIRTAVEELSNTTTTETVFSNGSFKIDYETCCAWKDGEQLHLSPTEYRLLSLLTRDAGKVLTYQYLIKQMWGENREFLLEKDMASLRVYMGVLRKRIDRGSKEPSILQTMSGEGYRMVML